MVKTAAIAASLAAAAFAADGASFMAGGSFVYAHPSYSESALGGGLNFEYHQPSDSVKAVSWGARVHFLSAVSSDFINVNDTNASSSDIDRDYYWAGISYGPKFSTEKLGNTPYYALGTVGLMANWMYTVETAYSESSKPDRAVKSQDLSLGLGVEGSFGVGYKISGNTRAEFAIVGQASGSRSDGQGIMMSYSPKLTFGFAL
jgi:hypothetical protein